MVGVRGNVRLTVVAKMLALVVGACFGLWVNNSATALASPPQYELIRKFGPDGTALSGFAGAGPVAVDQTTHFLYAADTGAGKLDKFESDGTPLNWGGSSGYISGNQISGLSFAGEGSRQIAVDSNAHTVYVTTENTVRAFQENGEPAIFVAGPGAGTNVIGGFDVLKGLAVDSKGYIYTSDYGEGIVKIFAPSGEPVTEFATSNPANLAVDTVGAVYVVRRFSTVLKFTASSFPVTPATTYTAAAEPLNSNETYSVGVDPATNNVYVVRLDHPGVSVYGEGGAFITSFGGAGSEGELFIADGIAIDGNAPGVDTTHVLVGNQPVAGLNQVNVYRPKPPTAPSITEVAVGGVTESSASLNALINPNQAATTYRFEYGLSDCSISVCTSVPAGGAGIGSGNDGVWVAQEVQGLQKNTQYHYRVMAENSFGFVERMGMFTTEESQLVFGLSDTRAWEMVSPPDKHGALLRGIEDRGGHIQAAADGNGIAYVSIAPEESDPEGNRLFEPSSVLARRSENGWSSEDITAPNDKVVPVLLGRLGEYKLFSTDLSKAIMDARTVTLLSPEASERAPYLRFNASPPGYSPLVTGKEGFANVPPGTEFGGSEAFLSSVAIENATPDLTHVVLSSSVPLVEGAPSETSYEWVDGQLKPVAVLSATEGGGIVEARSGSGTVSLRRAISRDGSRVFWTAIGADPHLYMREMVAEETVRIDQVQPGASGAGTIRPVFQGASSDGTVVFFTDTQQLTEDASPSGADLYRCELEDPAAGCTNLTDLSVSGGEPGESGQVQGVVSALSEDGSRIYFVAKGILDIRPNQFGYAATAGEPNLYFWQEGEGPRFIATLAKEDRPDWGLPGTIPQPGRVSGLSASGSPSGRYFAFMSERQLTDPEDPSALNIDLSTKEAAERVFRYDAVAEKLECVSCAPTGAAPRGAVLERGNELVDPRTQWLGRRVAASLPQAPVLSVAGETIYQPRVVLDSGRVFFNAIDPLVLADSNAQWDVYQYEDLGTGDCSATSGNAAIARSGEGCVSLVSSGTGNREAGFLDASVTGNDVFFLTPARLSATDVDSEMDLYDARVGGVSAVVQQPSECRSGESCHPAPAAVPDAAPASAFFSGAGNLKPHKHRRRCPKGTRKVRSKGKQRCVHRKGGKHHRRAGQKKGAGR